jgi:hypothetical protein
VFPLWPRSCHRLFFAFALGFALTTSPDATAAEATPVTLNVRDFGAIGDGRLHPVSEWIRDHRYPSLRVLRKEFPFVKDDDWTIDEIAFERAKAALPPDGGTIHFPAGHYVAGHQGWRIWRDHVRLTGDGAEKTILSTGPAVAEGLVLAPYRHVGWLEGASHEFPFTNDSGARGTDVLQFKSSEGLDAFSPGQLVFIRCGANRFDQDYGEFNEVTAVEPNGRIHLKHPLSRDYTLTRLNWAAEVARDFKMPRAGGTVTMEVKSGEGYFLPGVGAAVTVGNDLFRVQEVKHTTLRLANLGRGNSPRDTLIASGTKIGKARSVIIVTRTTRNFRCERVQIVGHRKVLNLSNSYESVFVDCRFTRDNTAGKFKGGLTIDGDGGRFARFERCSLDADPPAGMQFARSFGGVRFTDCRFQNANVAFTEFCFDAVVENCEFEVRGTRQLTNVIIAGNSCGDLTFRHNRIRAQDVAMIFDPVSDIHSQKHGGGGTIVVADNEIECSSQVRVFGFPKSSRISLERNRVEVSEPKR